MLTNEQKALWGFHKIPQELKDLPQWVVWKLEKKEDGKLTKVPYTPLTPYRASSTKPSAWRTFEEALDHFRAGGCGGIGFVFSEDDPYCGVDIDHCVQIYEDGQLGNISDTAIEILNELDSYAELSQSKTGIHILVKGTVPKGIVRVIQDKLGEEEVTVKVEMYSSGRYFCMTGFALVLDSVVKEYPRE